jgi:DNA-binding MarR family transcriptional regulator
VGSRRRQPLDEGGRSRARLIGITPRGRQAIPLAASVVADVESDWSRHLGKRRMQQLRETLAKLREITDPYAPL